MDTLPLVSPEQVGLSAARLARISTWMKGWVDSGKLPLSWNEYQALLAEGKVEKIQPPEHV